MNWLITICAAHSHNFKSYPDSTGKHTIARRIPALIFMFDSDFVKITNDFCRSIFYDVRNVSKRKLLRRLILNENKPEQL